MTSKCLSKTYDYMKRNHYSSRKESRAIPWLFSHSWEQRKVADVASFTKGSGYSKSDIRDKGVPLILYGRLYTKYETVIREVDTYAVPKDGSVYSRGGEVIVPASGETAEDISIASVVEKSGVLLGGDLNIVTPGDEIDSAFLALSISYGRTHRDLSKLAQGKSVVHIHNSDIQSVDLRVPKLCEQEKIGNFFIMLDDLITLHQRDKSSRTALGSVERKEKANAWEQREFKQTFDLLTNNTLSRAELNNEKGSVQNIHYGDILVKFGEIIDLREDDLPYITDEINSSKTDFLQDGDIIIADTAEDSTVGKCAEVMGISDANVVSGLHTIPCRPRKRYAQGYLGYFMNSSAYHDQLLPLMQGTKVTSVSKSALQETILCFPTDIKEQALIGDYFMRLDDLITLHQRECKYQITEDKNVKQNQRDRPLLRLLRSVDWGV